MDTLLDRFLRYVKVDTQSDETSPSFPSTKKQLVLSKMLCEECEQLGLEDVTINEYGIVMATVPGNVDGDVPAIGWVAHVDTSPEFSGTNVKPVVHENYDGSDLVLPGDPSRVLRVSEEPRLKQMVGKTVITTDGTTLLGADDKSGVAVMMSAAAQLMGDPSILHGPIRLCFTCDEEIGRGIEKLNLEAFGVCCAYTLDSDGSGRIDSETFSADQAVITVRGVNTHPSVGKGVMVNAIRILSDLISSLPTETLSPETTDGRDGFIHPYHIEGGVAEASARLILRDFETEKLAEYAGLLDSLAEPLRQKFPRAEIKIEVHKQYRNMRDGLVKEPRALEKAIEATRAAGLEPKLDIIRGGTDGSLLTEKGLPTPNLSSGQHNPHSPLEWTTVEEMQQAVDVLVQLAILWGEER
ncbi:peptidase T [Gimesia panareensis]|uniref:Peptidase T n=1 Tax=Gimesia panareensis TaxID=2527978 RepID=A0A517Q5R2_9PLAN|nr:peptidase T [Gimesia panareensis]QDT26943.1 Peptidase T [Gimesia panareensis]QDU50209.1 Peptidase T [Gimesia panareensis]